MWRRRWWGEPGKTLDGAGRTPGSGRDWAFPDGVADQTGDVVDVQLLHDARAHVETAARHLLDGLSEVLARLGLEHEPPHPRLDRVRHQALLLKGREHHDLGSRARLDDLARGIDAVQERHHDVEHGDVRLMLPRQLDRRPAIGSLGYDLEAVPLEQGTHALSEHDVIVGQHYA